MKKILTLVLALALLIPCLASASEYYDDRLTVVAMLGEESDFIYTVETALYEKGWLDEVCVDGYFDEYTEMAVLNFQYYKNYEPTGMLTKIQFYWLHRKYYNEWFDSSYIVWITPSGTRYHLGTCRSLDNVYGVMPISVNIAYDYGYDPCKLCKPY